MKNFIEVFDNAISSEDCKYIIDYMNSSNLMVPGSVSTNEGDVKVVEEIKTSTEMAINIEDKNQINDIISTSLLHQVNKYKESYPQLDQLARWGVKEKYNLKSMNQTKDILHYIVRMQDLIVELVECLLGCFI